jgi:hypothetical protein
MLCITIQKNIFLNICNFKQFFFTFAIEDKSFQLETFPSSVSVFDNLPIKIFGVKTKGTVAKIQYKMFDKMHLNNLCKKNNKIKIIIFRKNENNNLFEK